VETLEEFWPIGSRPRIAMAIMLYLGVRRSDAVLIGKKHESKDGLSVSFVQFKGRKRGAKVLTLPILPPFREIPDASELGQETWLETSFGKPYRVAGFGNSFKDWCKEAGPAYRNAPATACARMAPSALRRLAQANMNLWRCSAGKMPIWRAFIRARRRKENWPRAGLRS
jgi:hypothetical protein